MTNARAALAKANHPFEGVRTLFKRGGCPPQWPELALVLRKSMRYHSPHTCFGVGP